MGLFNSKISGVLLLGLGGRVLLCSPRRTHYVAKNNLEHLIFLIPNIKCEGKRKKPYKHNREWNVSYNRSAVTISGIMPGKTLGKGGGRERALS